MAYQLSDLIIAVRKRVKDTTFDADLITQFLQEANNQVVERNRFPFMEVAVTDTVSQGASEYELDSEVELILVLKLTDLTTNNTFAPDYVPYGEFYDLHQSPETATASSPAEFTLFGNTVYWSAPLSNTYQLSIKYIKTPVILVDDEDTPDVPERFKEILMRGAVARVEDYRQNFDIAALHERKVEELSEDMLTRLALRQLTKAPKARFGRR